MSKLIGIVGHKGSGKSSIVAEAINHEFLQSVCHMGFSTPICNMLVTMGVPQELVIDKNRWDDPLDILCGKTIRYAAQTLGTEWGRKYIGQHVWTNIAFEMADIMHQKGRNVIIDNVRFPSEADCIESKGGILIAFYRPGLEINLNHESERHIPELQKRCGYEFVNGGTFRQGVENLQRLLVEIIM